MHGIARHVVQSANGQENAYTKNIDLNAKLAALIIAKIAERNTLLTADCKNIVMTANT